MVSTERQIANQITGGTLSSAMMSSNAGSWTIWKTVNDGTSRKVSFLQEVHRVEQPQVEALQLLPAEVVLETEAARAAADSHVS